MHSADFLSLMACAQVMVGNSSAAIREAPSFRLPAVNIGTRQQGRLRAKNVIDVGNDTVAIENAIKQAIYDKDFLEKLKDIPNPYGDGESAKRIVDILEKIELTPKLIQKRIAYA